MNEPSSNTRNPQTRPRFRPTTSFLVKAFLGLSLFGAILYFVDFREAWGILAETNLWYVAAYIGLIYADRPLMAYKWKLLITALNVRIPYFPLLRMYSAAPLVGTLVPASIGSDLFRLYSLSRYRVDTAAVISSIVVEKVIGLAALLVPVAVSLAIASVFFSDEWAHFRSVMWAMLILLAIGGVTLWAMQSVVKNRIDSLAHKYARIPLVGKIHRAYTTFSEYRNHWRVIGFVFVLTVIEQMAPIVGTFFLIKALNIDVAFWKLLVVVPIVVLIIRMPAPLDIIGVQEGINVLLFGLIGFSVEEAVIMTLLGRALDILCALPWGVQYIFGRHGHTVADSDDGKRAASTN